MLMYEETRPSFTNGWKRRRCNFHPAPLSGFVAIVTQGTSVPSPIMREKLTYRSGILIQAVIGNPAHDLIRLGLSLASAVRGSGLPGIITAQLIENLMSGYEHAFDIQDEPESKPIKTPTSIKIAKRKATRRTWKELAKERLEQSSPLIPLGKNFWPLSREERASIEKLFELKTVTRLATSLHPTDDNAAVKFLDAAYWQKGCSSLGNLRYAVLLHIQNSASDEKTFCLMDIKEATLPVTPQQQGRLIPGEHAERVVAASRHLSPYLGERMVAARLLDTSVFLRELLPQDMKIEVGRLDGRGSEGTRKVLGGDSWKSTSATDGCFD